jgi:hypothetical protein
MEPWTALPRPVVHLQPDAIHPIYDGLHNTVNDSARRQAHSDAVTDLELSFIWLLWLGWHAGERTLV